ncbi:MAG: DUF192 domain-containing protein [Candidatus Kerfeldbacteria bacterium]|nr:DUF192 domain-containing protein [Candidatus Kerfeldbacteria bacterium]
MVGKALAFVLAGALLIFGLSLWPDARGWLTERRLGAPSVSQGYGHGTVTFAETAVEALIPLTPERQAQGLAGRTRLGDGEGMLWVYGQPGYYRFWMKGMLIPIDILWIQNQQVVEISTNLPPPATDQPAAWPTYQSQQPVNAVLEVASGFAARHRIAVGDQVDIDKR